MALIALILVPEAVAKPSQPVEVTLVSVPLVAAKVVKFNKLPVAFVKTSWVAVAAEKTAVPPSKFTLFAVKFNAVKLEPEAVAKPSHWVDVTFVKLPLVNVPFVKAALVPFTKVANKFVAVVLVKTPVEGVVFPIGVPLIEPPEIVALEEVRAAKLALKAFKVDPDAVAKPNHCVEVTLVKLPLVNEELVPDKVVATKFAKKALVPVTLVKVELVANKFAISADEVTLKLVVTKFPVEVPPANWMLDVATFP